MTAVIKIAICDDEKRSVVLHEKINVNYFVAITVLGTSNNILALEHYILNSFV